MVSRWEEHGCAWRLFYTISQPHAGCVACDFQKGLSTFFREEGLLPVQKTWQEEPPGIVYCQRGCVGGAQLLLLFIFLCHLQLPVNFFISISNLCFLCPPFVTPSHNIEEGENGGRDRDQQPGFGVLSGIWIGEYHSPNPTQQKERNILHSDILQSHGKILNFKMHILRTETFLITNEAVFSILIALQLVCRLSLFILGHVALWTEENREGSAMSQTEVN